MFFQPIWAFTQRYTVATCVFPSRTPKAMATMAIGNDSASRCRTVGENQRMDGALLGVKFSEGWSFEFFFDFVPQKNNKWKRQKQPTYQGKAVRISSCWVFCYLPGCDFFVAVFHHQKGTRNAVVARIAWCKKELMNHHYPLSSISKGSKSIKDGILCDWCHVFDFSLA